MDNTNLFFQIFNLHGQSWLLDKFMISSTNYLIYATFLFIFILGYKGRIKEKKALLLIILGIPIAIVLIKIIHLFFFEPRPFVTLHFSPIVSEAMDASFPSRHATIIAVIAFSFTYFKSKWAPLFLFLMLLIGFSRIFVGVHYPLDVLGGFITGLVAVAVALQTRRILKLKSVK